MILFLPSGRCVTYRDESRHGVDDTSQRYVILPFYPSYPPCLCLLLQRSTTIERKSEREEERKKEENYYRTCTYVYTHIYISTKIHIHKYVDTHTRTTFQVSKCSKSCRSASSFTTQEIDLLFRACTLLFKRGKEPPRAFVRNNLVRSTVTL